MAESAQEEAKTSTDPVVVSELTKQLQSAVLKQIEYYFSDENLKQDEFFNKIIKNSEIGAIPVDTLLNCNKLKKLEIKKSDILDAVANSEELEVTGDGVGIKRKNPKPIPEYEPKIQKKVKTEKKSGYGKDESTGFEAKIYKIKLSQPDSNLKWNEVQSAIEKEFGKVNYTRLNNGEGHIAMNQNSVPSETLEKLGNATVKVGDVDVQIENCIGDDLKEFYRDHGSHLDMCLERAGLKKKAKRKDKEKDALDFIFYNQKYTSIAPLKYIFKSLLQKTQDGEAINEVDQKLLLELLKYHENYDQKVKDLKHFTVGMHPTFADTKCFFIVRNDGSKEDFSFQKCLENVRNQVKVSDKKK